MALYVQTNTSSMVAQNALAKTELGLHRSFQRLSSGFRINSAADDASGLGISKQIHAQVRSLAVAERNSNDGISMSQAADGGAEQIHGLLTRMRELAVQASNGGLSLNDSINLNTEFQATLSEIDRIATSTQFNGANLLDNALQVSVNFQVGIGTATTDRIAILFGGANATALSVNTMAVGGGAAAASNFTMAQAAITQIDIGIQRLSTIREGFGAAMNRFAISITNLQSMQTNMSAALSRIRDVDIASETAALARNQVLAQAGASVLGQANQSPQLALGLLRGN